jgi:hypothetical protein
MTRMKVRRMRAPAMMWRRNLARGMSSARTLSFWSMVEGWYVGDVNSGFIERLAIERENMIDIER